MSKVYTINTGNKEEFLGEYARVSGSNITGSFFGTASRAVTSSFAVTASFSPTAIYAVTSSYIIPSGLPAGVISSSTQQVVSTYTNATDNRVLTSTGTGGINGESALTFDGSALGVGTTTPKNILDLGVGTNNRGISWGGVSNNYANIWTQYSSGYLNLAIGVSPTGSST